MDIYFVALYIRFLIQFNSIGSSQKSVETDRERRTNRNMKIITKRKREICAMAGHTTPLRALKHALPTQS